MSWLDKGVTKIDRVLKKVDNTWDSCMKLIKDVVELEAKYDKDSEVPS